MRRHGVTSVSTAKTSVLKIEKITMVHEFLHILKLHRPTYRQAVKSHVVENTLKINERFIKFPLLFDVPCFNLSSPGSTNKSLINWYGSVCMGKPNNSKDLTSN